MFGIRYTVFISYFIIRYDIRKIFCIFENRAYKIVFDVTMFSNMMNRRKILTCSVVLTANEA